MSDQADDWSYTGKGTRRSIKIEIRAKPLEHLLLRLIAQHGLAGAAWVLRVLVDELEAALAHLGPVGQIGAAVPKMNQVVAVDRRAARLSSGRHLSLACSQAELLAAVEHPDITLAVLRGVNLSPEENVKVYFWLTLVMRSREFAWLQFRGRHH